MKNLGQIVEALKQERERLSKEISGISAALAAFGKVYSNGKNGSKISAAGRARIAAAQRARWAKARAIGKKKNVTTTPKRGRLSVAARKRIAAAQRARWAKVRAAAQKA